MLVVVKCFTRRCRSYKGTQEHLLTIILNKPSSYLRYLFLNYEDYFQQLQYSFFYIALEDTVTNHNLMIKLTFRDTRQGSVKWNQLDSHCDNQIHMSLYYVNNYNYKCEDKIQIVIMKTVCAYNRYFVTRFCLSLL